jgi:two-component system nitrate/nitrite response regulator NarL
MQPTRILVGDDHPIFRQGLLAIFRNEPAFSIVGEAATGEQALQLTRELRPDVLLLDLLMPGLGGLDTLRELWTSATPVRTILLTAVIEKEQIAQALQLGARGIVLKEAPTPTLFKSIDTVMAGQFWVRDSPVPDLVEFFRTQLPSGDGSSRKSFGLTPRELEVVTSVASGFSNREIAEKYSISEQTVKHHLRNIFDKLGVSNRLELALFAINHLIVPRE